MISSQQCALEQQRRFTADASHELKSPLTVIKGTVGMVLASDPPFTPEQQRSALETIGQATESMVALVQDLLLLARSDGWQLGQSRIEVLLDEVLEQAVKLTPSEGAPVTLTLTDPALTVVGNESELIRLFANLLDNARRHTPPSGQVTATAERDGDTLIVRVDDTGVGIAAEHLPRLFERFYRIDDARTRGMGGNGLGLAICKAIAEAHGATIEVSSQVGVGTRVTVRLPQADS
jgi:signal transduction histidine kinase